MYHSIFFLDGIKARHLDSTGTVKKIVYMGKDTWDDWHLIPSSRPVFNPPSPKTSYIDIPGSDWGLDLSESLTGEVVYDSRKGSLEFIVDNGHQEWHELYSDIMDYLHGKVKKAVLEDDPTYYYEGRFWVNQWKSDPGNSKITIDYEVQPYKLERYSSFEDKYSWEWDSFNFEKGYVREYWDLEVDGEFTITIPGQRKSVVPTFKVSNITSSYFYVEFNGNKYYLSSGDNQSPHIVLKEGENILTFVGNATVSIDYQGGRL